MSPGPVFIIDACATVSASGMSIRNGHASSIFSGGGITNDDTLTLTNSTVTGMSNDSGGAGGIANRGTLTLTNSTISGNSGGSGMIRNEGTLTQLTLTNSTIRSSRTFGSAILNSGGTAKFINTTVSSNIGEGAIFNAGLMTLTNTTVSQPWLRPGRWEIQPRRFIDTHQQHQLRQLS